ncbi:hypothetical protein [Cytophaga aurantiaca]|uniref:hypothetical protein n=1 Tax=Cytophaga aurantiaca TaxID=29530 RepID=UPI0003751FFC|nr:hypothetical protein [Cytophaga aurantiaca]
MKIIQVINTMITNQSKISDIIRKNREYFFIYDKKHKWSIAKLDDEEEYFLHLYPTDELDIKQLSTNMEWEGFTYVTYSSEDIKTKEGIESFRELYQILSDKVLGIDDIFNDILKDEF